MAWSDNPGDYSPGGGSALLEPGIYKCKLAEIESNLEKGYVRASFVEAGGFGEISEFVSIESNGKPKPDKNGRTPFTFWRLVAALEVPNAEYWDTERSERPDREWSWSEVKQAVGREVHVQVGWNAWKGKVNPRVKNLVSPTKSKYENFGPSGEPKPPAGPVQQQGTQDSWGNGSNSYEDESTPF